MNKAKLKTNSQGRLEEFTINDVPVKGVTELNFKMEVDTIPKLNVSLASDVDIEIR